MEDYPCCYSGGNNCAQVKIRLNAKPCCPPSEQGVYERINDLESAQGYECQTGFSCQRVEWQTVECDGPDGNPYPCGVNPTGFACGYPPPPTPTPTPTLTPTPTPTPSPSPSVCDEDADGYTAQSCGGNDCNDEVAFIPLRDPSTGMFLQETAGRICENGEDDDCDGLRDYEEDPSCNGQPTPTPTPCPCDDCDLGCPPGGGNEYPTNYSYYCYSSYMVTTYWISYDNGQTWSYLLETWDYVGSYCTVTQ